MTTTKGDLPRLSPEERARLRELAGSAALGPYSTVVWCAAANPETVLRLLDHIEALEAERDAARERSKRLAQRTEAFRQERDSAMASTDEMAGLAAGAVDRLEERVRQLEAESRRWYQADGTFVELPAEEVVAKRKEAARQLGGVKRLLAAVQGLSPWIDDSADEWQEVLAAVRPLGEETTE